MNEDYFHLVINIDEKVVFKITSFTSEQYHKETENLCYT